MKIYTKTGDDGSTGLIGGIRISKDELRMSAIGDIDELNAQIGVASELSTITSAIELLHYIQCDLFSLGAALADPKSKYVTDTITAAHVTALEKAIDERDSKLTPLKNFILPTGTLPAAHLHLARAVCRRAERSLVRLNRTEPLNPHLLTYLNRLSDLLFILAREDVAQTSKKEVIWKPHVSH